MIAYQDWNTVLPENKVNGTINVCFDALRPSQQFFSHVRTISCLPGLNQC